MRLTFLGTKGYIEESSPRHKLHPSILIEQNNFRLMIDHGMISRKLTHDKPDTILITHAHPDTFKWLKEDEDYSGKIYVTRETKKASKFEKNFQLLKLNEWIKIGPFKILPYRVVHSINAPTVGYKIKYKNKTIIYNSDLVVPKNKAVLNDVNLYIGDGSCFRANLVRKRDNKLFGHARMSTQRNWCKKYKIPKVIFTHLGKEPLRIGDKKLEEKLNSKEVSVKIAHDGMKYSL